MQDNYGPGLILAFSAGLATAVGGLLALYKKSGSKGFLSISLGFSAGVMIYISFVELFQQAQIHLGKDSDPRFSDLYVNLAFFGGIALIALIDGLVPKFENPHEIPQNNGSFSPQEKSKVLRLGVMSIIAIAVHNFPEGMATFVASMENIQLGTKVAIAIGIHNIPEGIAIAVPVFAATGSRSKAFLFALIAGLCEPLGSLFALLLMQWYWSDALLGILFAGIAGIMVFISLDQLLPHAERYGHHHYAIYGLISGMIVMAASLLIV